MTIRKNRFQFTDTEKLFTPTEKGTARILVDEPSGLDRVRGAMNGQPLNRDKYVRLIVNNETVMTDSEFERMTNGEFLREMRGDCLIAGLGLGFILAPALRECKSVTVIEKNQDVIDLVAPKFKSKKLTVIHGDIKDFRETLVVNNGPNKAFWKDRKFDTIYLDIWGDFSSDTSREAGVLKRGLKKWLRPGGWIGDWSTQAMKFGRRR